MFEYSKMNVSPDFLVLGLIWKAQKEGNLVTFTDLKKELEGVVSTTRISTADDRLQDLGLVETTWTKRDNGSHGMGYFVCGVGRKIAQEILDYMENPTAKETPVMESSG